jgi:nicotinamidase-related amidase
MGHKIVRHRSPVVLLLVDVVNHFEFPDGEAILKNALQIAPRLARLKKRARDSNIPVVYVNDNFGQWRSDAGKLLAHCLRTDCAGKPFVEAINQTNRIIASSNPCIRRFFRRRWICCSDTLAPRPLSSRGLPRTGAYYARRTTRTCGSSRSQ